MQKVTQEALISRAVSLLEDGTVTAVLGWRRGEFDWDMTPAVFTTAEDIENNFIYNDFCGANLSKYLLRQTRKIEGKILVPHNDIENAYVYRFFVLSSSE